MAQEASRKWRETTGYYTPLLREVSRKVVNKNRCGTSQSFILSNTLAVFAKNGSHIGSSFLAKQALFLSQNGRPRQKDR